MFQNKEEEKDYFANLYLQVNYGEKQTLTKVNYRHYYLIRISVPTLFQLKISTSFLQINKFVDLPYRLKCKYE